MSKTRNIQKFSEMLYTLAHNMNEFSKGDDNFILAPVDKTVQDFSNLLFNLANNLNNFIKNPDFKLADGAVTTAKLADGAVTTAKLDDGAVTTAKLDEELNEKINNNVIYYPTFIDNLPATGETNIMYLISSDLPSQVKTFIQKAYEHWGDLTNYPHFILFNRSEGRTAFLLTGGTNTIRTSDNVLLGAGGLMVTLQNSNYSYDTPSYMAHSFINIDYANVDIAKTDSTSVIVFTHNCSPFIDYSTGTLISEEYQCNIYKNNEFINIGNMNIKPLIEGTIKPLINALNNEVTE